MSRGSARFIILLACVPLSGCSFNAMFAGGHSLGDPMEPGCSKSEAVARVNANALAIQSWRSNDVKIGARGMPGKLSATIAVERPRNFRLRARSLGTDEADLGSNDERFWFWMRRSEVPHVVTVRHDELHLVQPRVQIPFQPDWLMEVLGVVPIDESVVTMQPAGRDGEVLLNAETLTPAGQPVRRLVRIDVRHGIVLGHSLYDETNRLIAKAALSHHRRDRDTHAILPHRIDLEWPQANLALTMEIGRVEVNGAPSTTLWQMPLMREFPPLDLGRRLQAVPAEAGTPTGLRPVPAGDQAEALPSVGQAFQPDAHKAVPAGDRAEALPGRVPEDRGREEPQWHRPILHVKPEPGPDDEPGEDTPPWTATSQADWQRPRWRMVEEPPWTR